MFRFIILMLATMSLANIAQGACVEEPSARPVVEDSMDIVAEGHHLFGKQKIDLALLADGDIAVKKQESGEVEIIYADGFRQALPLGKKATTIQGLSDRGLLVVKHPDGTKSLITNKI